MSANNVLCWAIAAACLTLTSFGWIEPQHAQASPYAILDLETPGVDISSADCINNAGWIVGHAGGVPCLWIGGQIQDITTRVGDVDRASFLGMNDCGMVVGYLRGESQDRAFVAQAGSVTVLGGPGSWASAVNNWGQVVGGYHCGSVYHACLWEGSMMRDLGTLAGDATWAYSEAFDVNNQGEVVGYSDHQGSEGAFLWRNGVMTALNLPNKGDGNAFATNDRGQVVGIMRLPDPSSNYHAFLWQNGSVRDLGVLPGCMHSGANDVNNRGQVVGSSGQYSAWRPFLWDGGTMYDLNDLLPAGSGWVLDYKWSSSSTINDHGQIVGTGMHNGVQRAFLMSPTVDPVPDQTRLVQLLSPEGPFKAKFEAGFTGLTLTIHVGIRLIGADPGPVRQIWEEGAERMWSNQYDVLCEGVRYPIVLDVEFVDADEDAKIMVLEGEGSYYVSNPYGEWYTESVLSWGPEYRDEAAAHEVGHILGLYDEYDQNGRGLRDPTNPIIDMTSIMGSLKGTPKERHFLHFLQWIEGETGREMVLGESPLYRPGELGAPVGDGAPTPEPATLVLMVAGAALLARRRRR